MGAGRGQSRRSRYPNLVAVPLSIGDQCIFQRPDSVDSAFLEAYHNQIFEIVSPGPEDDSYVVAFVDEDGYVQRNETLTVHARHLTHVPRLELV